MMRETPAPLLSSCPSPACSTLWHQPLCLLRRTCHQHQALHQAVLLYPRSSSPQTSCLLSSWYLTRAHSRLALSLCCIHPASSPQGQIGPSPSCLSSCTSACSPQADSRSQCCRRNSAGTSCPGQCPCP